MSDFKPIGEMTNINRAKDLFPPLNLSPITQDMRVSMVDDTYSCIICKDAHFVHPLLESGKLDYSRAVPCLCSLDRMAREKSARLLTWCELPAASEGMTFSSFKASPGLEMVLKAAKAVVSGELKWLTLSSGVNRGKTHLAIAICREWLEGDKPARYAYVPLLLDELRRGYQEEDYDKRFDMFLNVPLLCLDDLGAENSTPWVQEKLDTIVDYRMMHGLSLVVTTNLSLKQLPERIASRLSRNGKIVTISGPEYRR